MEAIVLDWLNLLFRWLHVIAGIMWVGNSMLFNWLDRNLQGAGGDASKFGDAWLLHSGGFYKVEKFKAEGGRLPPLLHWFKWQSYTTWMSGCALLVLVYYLGGEAQLRDPNSPLSLGLTHAVGLGTLVLGWLLYDGAWRLIGPRAPGLASTAFGLALVAVGYGLCQVLTGRAAYMHAGALMGTLMAGNVFFHIIPSQKQLVAALTAGQPHDLALSDRAKLRSIHNNYLTFPVIFTMISNHFGAAYGHPQNWLILTLLCAGGALVRLFLNIRYTTPGWLAGVLASLALSFGVTGWMVYAAQPAPPPPAAAGAPVPSFAQVREIIVHRCTACHSRYPTQPALALATQGVYYDTPEEIKVRAERILFRAVTTKTMPLGNMTQMTDEERAVLAAWIAAGSPLK